MNLDSLSFTLSQISYLVASLTKKNYEQVVAELSQVSFNNKLLEQYVVIVKSNSPPCYISSLSAKIIVQFLFLPTKTNFCHNKRCCDQLISTF